MDNETSLTLAKDTQQEELSADAIRNEIEIEIKRIARDAGYQGTEEIKLVLDTIFSQLSQNKSALSKHHIIDLINQQKNIILALLANSNSEEQHIKLINSHDNASPTSAPNKTANDATQTSFAIENHAKIKKIRKREPSNRYYERLYFILLEALEKKDKERFFKIADELHHLGFGFEKINEHIQKVFPGERIFGQADLLELESEQAQTYRYPFSKYDLFISILKNNPKMIRDIIQANPQLLFARDINNSMPLNYFAFLPNYLDYKDILIPAAGKNETEVKDFIKVSRARIAVGLSYSTDNFFGLFRYGYENLMSLMIEDIPNFMHKDTIQKSLRHIQTRQILEVPNNPKFSKVQLIQIPYIGHAAYLIVKYDKRTNKPTQISYCDGNLIHDRKSAEIVFDIDPKKLAQLGGDIENYVKNSFKEVYIDAPKDVFNRGISKLVKCDASNTPIIVDKNIPSKPQNRGNCAYKSMNIALRVIMKELDPTLEFDKKGGNGYEAFKQYKEGIRDSSLEKLLECAENHGLQNQKAHDQLIESLKPVFLQSIRKGNNEIRDRVVEIFKKENINLNSVKSNGHKNALFFAVKSDNLDMVKWCYDNNIAYETNEKGSHPGLFAKSRDVAEFLASKQMPDLDKEQRDKMLDQVFGPKLRNAPLPMHAERIIANQKAIEVF